VLLAIPLLRADFVPHLIVVGDVPVVTSEAQSTFDGPKIGAVNGTSYDTWYFQATSADGKTSALINFWRSAIDEIEPDDQAASWVEIDVILPNTTIIDRGFISNTSSVTATGFGASGVWSGNENATFVGAPDLSTFTIQIDAAEFNGSLTIRSTTPAQYPGGEPPGSNASAYLAPNLYWTNAIPVGVAHCQFTINGELFEIKGGLGYHDQQWGGLPQEATVRSWYWGHAQAGPYSLVWFDSIAFDGITKYSSVYLAENGTIITASRNVTTTNDTFVLPIPSQNSSFPPGFYINFNGAGKQWSFVAQNDVQGIHSGNVESNYTMWVGQMRGGEVDSDIVYGTGEWEWNVNPGPVGP